MADIMPDREEGNNLSIRSYYKTRFPVSSNLSNYAFLGVGDFEILRKAKLV